MNKETLDEANSIRRRINRLGQDYEYIKEALGRLIRESHSQLPNHISEPSENGIKNVIKNYFDSRISVLEDEFKSI